MDISFARVIKDLGCLSAEELTSVFVNSARCEDDKRDCVTVLKEFKIASDEMDEMDRAYKTA